MHPLKLGTRGSQLALYQANTVAAALEARTGISCEIVVIKTTGDRLSEARLSAIGGKRLFVKEIEDALLQGDVDLAVHSSKDMPAVPPAGLEVGAVLPREDPRDAIVLPHAPARFPSIEAVVAHVGQTPRLGTSSIRRAAQLARLFPKGTFLPIRGNLDTRLRKLDSGEFDAIVLAAAGLRRLGQAERISAALPVSACVPAPGQGIIAVETRMGDADVGEAVRAIDDAEAGAALRAEQAVVRELGGGCQMPIGAYAVLADGVITVSAVVISPDGSRAVRAEAKGAAGDADAVGVETARRLLAQGAKGILDEVQRQAGAVEGLQP